MDGRRGNSKAEKVGPQEGRKEGRSANSITCCKESAIATCGYTARDKHSSPCPRSAGCTRRGRVA
jgi:hypothetical protein